MVNKIKVESVPLTRELASELAAMTPVEGERPLKEARLHFLGMHLEKGTFFGVEWHKGVERGSGKLYRLNGQHSSHLLIGLEPDKFRSEEHTSELQSQFHLVC